MKNMFDIVKELEQLDTLEIKNETINKETGEITIADSEVLKGLKEELKNEGVAKAEKYRYVILKLQKDIEMASDEIKRIQNYKKRTEKNIERAKELLMFFMNFLKEKKINFKNGASVSIAKIDYYEYDEEVLKAKECHLFDVVMKLDKNEAKKHFKKGLIKEGITVLEKESVRIK